LHHLSLAYSPVLLCHWLRFVDEPARQVGDERNDAGLGCRRLETVDDLVSQAKQRLYAVKFFLGQGAVAGSGYFPNISRKKIGEE